MNPWFKYPLLLICLLETFLLGYAAHGYVFDCHYFSPQEEYDLMCNDPNMSFLDWLDYKKERENNFIDWFGDECDCALNPYYTPPENHVDAD